VAHLLRAPDVQVLKLLQDDIVKWAKVVKASGARLD